LSLTVLVDVFVNKAGGGYASMAGAHVNTPCSMTTTHLP
jgi:hypothetical protein